MIAFFMHAPLRAARLPLVVGALLPLAVACSGSGGGDDTATPGSCVSLEDPALLPAAIAEAVDGDVVNVCAGTFQGPVSITSGITLRGAGPDATVILGDPDQALADPDAPTWVVAVEATAPVLIEGMTVDGSEAGVGLGVVVQSDNVSFKDVEIKGGGDAGIFALYPIVVEDSTVTAGDGVGIYLEDVFDAAPQAPASIKDTVIENRKHTGLYVSGIAVDLAGLDVNGSGVPGGYSGGDGIVVRLNDALGATDVLIRDVVVAASSGNGVFLQGGDVDVEGVMLVGNEGGFRCYGCTGSLSDATIQSSGDYGLSVESDGQLVASGVEVSGVTATEFGEGIRVHDDSTLELSESRVSDIEGVGFYASQSEATVEGVEITGARGTAVVVQDSTVDLRSVVISNTNRSSAEFASHGVVALPSIQGGTAYNDLSITGLTVSGTDVAVRLDNTGGPLSDISAEGVEYGVLVDGSDVPVVIDNANITDARLAAVSLLGVTGAQVNNSILTGSDASGDDEGYGLLVVGSDVSLEGSQLSGHHTAAIGAFSLGDAGQVPATVTTLDNDLINNDGAAALIMQFSVLTSEGDVFAGSPGSCVIGQGAAAMSFTDVEVSGCGTGLQLTQVIALAMTGSVVEGNTAFGLNLAGSVGSISDTRIAHSDVGLACGGAALSLCGLSFEGNTEDLRGCDASACLN